MSKQDKNTIREDRFTYEDGDIVIEKMECAECEHYKGAFKCEVFETVPAIIRFQEEKCLRFKKI